MARQSIYLMERWFRHGSDRERLGILKGDNPQICFRVERRVRPLVRPRGKDGCFQKKHIQTFH